MTDANLRPMGFDEILDGAFALYRRNFATLFLTALIPSLPMALIWMGIGLTYDGSTVEAGDEIGLQLLLLPLTVALTTLVWAALAHEVDRASRGETVSWRSGLAGAGRRFLPLLGAVLLVWLGVTVGFVLLVVPGILLAIRWFAVIPVVVLEAAGPIEAMRRSASLARGAWGRIFAVMAVLLLIVMLPSLAVGASVGIGAMLAADEGTASSAVVVITSQLLSTLVSAATTPLLIAGLVLLYYDRRVRVEGLDLELATERLGSAG